MNDISKCSPGFLERSQYLYKNLSCCILQSLIEADLRKAPNPRDALIQRLKTTQEEGKDKGTSKAFLRQHGQKNLETMLNYMDVTLCCSYLLSNNFPLTYQAEKAIKAIRNGRNLDSHAVNTAGYMEPELYKLWQANRKALLDLTDVFPDHTLPDIRVQINDYYNGTAGAYRPPAKSIRAQFQYAIDDGRINDALDSLLGTDLIHLAKAPATQYQTQYSRYLQPRLNCNRADLRQHAEEILSMLKTETALFALLYSTQLPHREKLLFLAEAANGPLQKDDAHLWDTVKQCLTHADLDLRTELLDEMPSRFPNWSERLYSLALSLSRTDAEARAHVRRGVLTGSAAMLERFRKAQTSHMEDILQMNWVTPTSEMESMAKSNRFPEEVRTLCRETQRTQVLARLAQDLTLPDSELRKCWVKYHENRHIVNSPFPEVQESVQNFKIVASRYFWNHATDLMRRHSENPHTAEALDLMERGCGRVENGVCACLPNSPQTAYMTTDLPEYAVFRTALLELRTLCSKVYWTQERERIAAAAKLPYGPEKMAVTPEENHAKYMDRDVDEYRLYCAEWEAFSLLRSKEYWQTQIAILTVLAAQPYSSAQEAYARDTGFDAVLVDCPAERKAWEDAYQQLRRNIEKERFFLETAKLNTIADGWQTLHGNIQPLLNAAQEALPIHDNVPTKQKLEELDRLTAPLSTSLEQIISAQKQFDAMRSRIGRAFTVEDMAFRDMLPRLNNLQDLLSLQRDHIRKLNTARSDLKRAYEAHLAKLDAAERKRKARVKTLKRLCTGLVVLAALIALLVGGRALLIKGILSGAASRAEDGDLVAAYDLLDGTTFFRKELEPHRLAMLSTIRQTMLDNGFRQDVLDSALQHDCEWLTKDAGLAEQEDLIPVPSTSVLVYQKAGNSTYYTQFEGNPMPLHTPDGLTIKCAWGSPYGNPRELFALCTDGTVLRGEVGWTFHTIYAEPAWYAQQYAEIAARGMTMDVVDHMDGVRLVIDRDGMLYHWMEDGRVLLDGTCIYTEVVSFASDSSGRLDIYSPLRADGRIASNLERTLPDGYTVDDVWEGNWYTVLNNGQTADDSEPEDILFSGIPGVTDYGSTLSVYDAEVEDWLTSSN